MPAPIATLAESWGSFYGDHTVVSVAVLFCHLAGLLIGGGAALAADRAILVAARDASQQAACLASLARAHRVVVPALVVMVVSGVLMALADFEAFTSSRVFYLKLALVALLGLNGLVLVWAERSADRGGATSAWGRLRATAMVSSVLWVGMVLVGVWLTKVG